MDSRCSPPGPGFYRSTLGSTPSHRARRKPFRGIRRGEVGPCKVGRGGTCVPTVGRDSIGAYEVRTKLVGRVRTCASLLGQRKPCPSRGRVRRDPYLSRRAGQGGYLVVFKQLWAFLAKAHDRVQAMPTIAGAVLAAYRGLLLGYPNIGPQQWKTPLSTTFI
jgi:hypothetical protein